jgi:hypothetical protein
MPTYNAGVGVSLTGLWQYREGNWVADVERNRLSNNAATSQEYNNNNFKGDRMVGKTHRLILIWYSSNREFYCNSATMNFVTASGDAKKQQQQ